MKNLKKELKRIAQIRNASGEYDDTELEGRYFIFDSGLDDFARKHKLTSASKIYRDEGEIFSVEKIERACDCRIIYDYEGSNPDRQFGDQEIIFN